MLIGFTITTFFILSMPFVMNYINTPPSDESEFVELWHDIYNMDENDSIFDYKF